MRLYPVNLDVHDQLCIVVGGGAVAGRKVASLLSCGARVSVISLEVTPRIAKWAGSGLLDLKQRKYNKGDLAGAKLVFAATNSLAIQKQIIAEAKGAGILVNVVNMPESCDFYVPASCRRGSLLISVATGGGSPALSARIRKELEESYGPEYEVLVALMGAVRKQIVGAERDTVRNKQLFDQLLDSDILHFIKQKQWSELKKLLQQILPSEIDVKSLLNTLRKAFNEEVLSC